MSKPKTSIQYEAPHLGGHANKTHTDRGVLKFANEVLGCKSILDIGCGPGGQLEMAHKVGFNNCIGLDGDSLLRETHDEVKKSGGPIDFIYVDFTKAHVSPQPYDMAWSCEFLEHVEEEYMDNYMKAFQACRWVFATHALPGKPGHHHVNCQEQSYWIKKFKEYGFTYDSQLSLQSRKASSMDREFYINTGMVYQNDKFDA